MAKAIKDGQKGTKKLAKRCRKQIRKLGFTVPIKTIVCDEGQDEVVLGEMAFNEVFGFQILEALEQDDAKILKGLLELAKFLGFDPYELEFCMGHEDGTKSDCDLLGASLFAKKPACVEAVMFDLANESVEAQQMHPVLDGLLMRIMACFDSGEFSAEKLESVDQTIRTYFSIRKKAGCLGDDFISTLSPSLKAMAMEVAAERGDTDDEDDAVQPHSQAPIAPAHSQTSTYSK